MNNKEPDKNKFFNLINRFTCSLLSYADYALHVRDKRNIFNTLFLGKTNAVASRLEEVLDYYNAKNNKEWAEFRENIAAIKLLTNVIYITLHLKSTSPQYNLLSGIGLFLEDTDKILESLSQALNRGFGDLVRIAARKGLKECDTLDRNHIFAFEFPEGRLDSDLNTRKIENPEKVIIKVATDYLNLASQSDILRKLKILRSEQYDSLIPDKVNENKLRTLENNFHNMQSLYDTYISHTDSEDLDEDLRLIRGHISMVFHLLEASTSLSHYYERHVMNLSYLERKLYRPPLPAEDILNELFDFYLRYATEFLGAGVTLCREVIGKYAEAGVLKVKVPSYRGFHVRPSTLVAKIVQHYGSHVFLEIGGEKYDASKPMDLFRVNEKINAEKRRNLALNICKLQSINDPECNVNFDRGLKEVFHELLEENKIINYSTEFALPDLHKLDEETLGEFANRAIAFLLAQGKIDLKTDLQVSFVGDKRVLSDLETLAKNGYGEDNYGNNIVLPESLSYLSR